MAKLVEYLYEIADSAYFFIKSIDTIEYSDAEGIEICFSLCNRYDHAFQIPIHISNEILIAGDKQTKSAKNIRVYSDYVLDLYTYKKMFGYGDDHIVSFQPGEIKEFKMSFSVDKKPDEFTLRENLVAEDDRYGTYHLKFSVEKGAFKGMTLRKQFIPYDMIEPSRQIEFFKKFREGALPGEKGIVCPCCGSVVTRSECSRTIGREIGSQHYKHVITEQDLLILDSLWACDNCLDSGKAIPGDGEKQRWADQWPYLAYYDLHKKCKKCHKDFVFSKEEQKYWYEELKFWVQSKCLHCLDCRKKLRAEKPFQKKRR